MSATSRREFLSGAAAASAGMACATLSVSAAPAEVIAPMTHDAMVAMDFIDWPRHQEGPPAPTRLACLFYGLICVDVGYQDALLPNAAGVPNVRPHQARFWTTTSSIVGSNPFTGSETGTDASGALTWVSTATYKVEFTPLTAMGARVDDLIPQSAQPKWRNSLRQPWTHAKWVRSLNAQTGRALIGNTQRENRTLVTSRIKMRGGLVTAIPPYTRQGQHAEWKSTLRDGSVVIAATTDSMLWTRSFPRTTQRVEVSFINAAGAVVKSLQLSMSSNGLPVAITHATDTPSSDPSKMTDSTAFARLLEGNDPSRFPIPELATLPRSAPQHSSEDVHCEGGKP